MRGVGQPARPRHRRRGLRAGRLDIGTAVLFRETEPPSAGQFLDLGCGYGVIGLALGSSRAAATVTGVDVNERAVLLANENAAPPGSTRFAPRSPRTRSPPT